MYLHPNDIDKLMVKEMINGPKVAKAYAQKGENSHSSIKDEVITEDGVARDGKLCECVRCKIIARCTPTFDFYTIDEHGKQLFCEKCFWRMKKNNKEENTTKRTHPNYYVLVRAFDVLDEIDIDCGVYCGTLGRNAFLCLPHRMINRIAKALSNDQIQQIANNVARKRNS